MEYCKQSTVCKKYFHTRIKLITSDRDTPCKYIFYKYVFTASHPPKPWCLSLLINICISGNKFADCWLFAMFTKIPDTLRCLAF